MKNTKFIGLFFVTMAVFNSCYYDIEEELYPYDVACDTVDVSFSADIVPILTTNCYACHDQANAFGGVVLDNYTAVKNAVNNSTLLGVVRHTAGFSPMPKGGNKLLDCEISKIETWITDGALDN